jgi:hypothetical protein
MSEEKESISSTSHVTDLREGKKQAILDLSFKHHEASKKKKEEEEAPSLKIQDMQLSLIRTIFTILIILIRKIPPST